MTLIGWEKVDDRWLLTFEQNPGWFRRLLGQKPRRVQYIGRASLWYFFPSFKVVHIDDGLGRLVEVITRLKYQIKFENVPAECIPPGKSLVYKK